MIASNDESPLVKPTDKQNLSGGNRVKSLANTTENRRSTSPFTSEALTSGKEITHAETSITDIKTPLCSNKLKNQINSLDGSTENKKLNGEDCKTLVFKLDSETGRYVTSDDELEHTTEKYKSGKNRHEWMAVIVLSC